MTPLLLAAAIMNQPEPPPTLKVMTYNIRYGTAPDGVNAWPNRKGMLLDLVKRHDPDVLGVQEALMSQVDEIRQALPGHEALGVGRDDGLLKGETSVIFTRRSLLGLREGGTRWISGEPERPWSLGGDARLTRIFTWGEFFLPGGRRILIVNAHLDHQSSSARLLGGKQMREWAEKRGLPSIVMGDFNSGPDDEPVEALEAGGLFRALKPAEGPYGTFTAFNPHEVNGVMIDHILATSHWDALSVEIDRTTQDGRVPSDHFPVAATLVLAR